MDSVCCVGDNSYVIDEPCEYNGTQAQCLSEDVWIYNSTENECLEAVCDKPERQNLYDTYEKCADECVKTLINGDSVLSFIATYFASNLCVICLNVFRLTND